MKKLLIIFLCAAGFCFAQAPIRAFEVGDPFPQFTVADIYGKEIDIGKLKGKVLVISVAYFDQSRKRTDEVSAEAKKLDDFYDSYKDKGLVPIRISSKRAVPILITKSFVESQARKTCEKNKDDRTVIIDWDNSLRKLLKMEDKPLTFIVDKSGIIRYKIKGFLTLDNEVKELVKKLI